MTPEEINVCRQTIKQLKDLIAKLKEKIDFNYPRRLSRQYPSGFESESICLILYWYRELRANLIVYDVNIYDCIHHIDDEILKNLLIKRELDLESNEEMTMKPLLVEINSKGLKYITGQLELLDKLLEGK